MHWKLLVGFCDEYNWKMSTIGLQWIHFLSSRPAQICSLPPDHQCFKTRLGFFGGLLHCTLQTLLCPHQTETLIILLISRSIL